METLYPQLDMHNIIKNFGLQPYSNSRDFTCAEQTDLAQNALTALELFSCTAGLIWNELNDQSTDRTNNL